MFWRHFVRKNPRKKHVCFERIEFFMRKSFEQTEIAKCRNEVPIGAIIVKNDNVISAGFNCSRIRIMHAEIAVILSALQKFSCRDLRECEIFVTHEPCSMCYEAIVLSRITRIFFCSYSDQSLKTRTHQCYGGISAKNSQNILKSFFKQRRKTIDFMKKCCQNKENCIL